MFFKDYVLLVMGRGVGKSWIDAVFCVLYAMLYPKTKIGIIAPVFRQACYVFDFIEELYDGSPYFRAAVRRSNNRARGIQRTYQNQICRFNNGSFIEALPLGDGNKVRGRRYHVVIADEYAQIDEEIIKLVVRPMMNVRKKGIKNKFITSSSAFYAWNHLYVQYLLYKVMEQRKPKQYAVHEYNYLDVTRIPDSPYEIDMDVINMQKTDMTEEAFNMENLAQFPVESKGFFPARLIESCVARGKEKTANGELIYNGPLIHLEGDLNARYTLGVDSARIAGGDNFAISVIKMEKGHQRSLAYVKSLNGATFQEMRNTIRATLCNFPITMIAMDPAGGGTTLKDLLAEPWQNPITGEAMQPIYDMDDKDIPPEALGVRSLKMVNFTQPMVNHLYQTLKADMQHHRFSFPIDVKKHPDRQLERAGWDVIATKQELMLLEAEPAGNFFRFKVPEGKKKDRATALSLANYAVNELLQEPDIPVPTLGVGVWA